MTCGVYVIKNVKNNRVYVGSSIDLDKRCCDHSSDLNRGVSRNKSLQEDWDLFPDGSFEFEILEECDSSLLLDKEQFHMDKITQKMGWNFLYNRHPNAGSPKGFKFSESTKRKMSISHKGVDLSDEHKKNISLARKGIVFSDEHRKNLKLAWKKRKERINNGN